jgi:hypothetical protein
MRIDRSNEGRNGSNILRKLKVVLQGEETKDEMDQTF